MKNLKQKSYKMGVGGIPTNLNKKWAFFGKWYKPWTWLQWGKVTLIKNFDLIEFSFVTVPVNEKCRIKK